MITSLGFGSTATETVLVCNRPNFSVLGTRWTRWTPPSNFSRSNASVIKSTEFFFIFYFNLKRTILLYLDNQCLTKPCVHRPGSISRNCRRSGPIPDSRSNYSTCPVTLCRTAWPLIHRFHPLTPWWSHWLVHCSPVRSFLRPIQMKLIILSIISVVKILVLGFRQVFQEEVYFLLQPSPWDRHHHLRWKWKVIESDSINRKRENFTFGHVF